jgi:hypothetical protein
VRDTTFWGWWARNYISGFEGTQAVPACPCDKFWASVGGGLC